MNVSVSNIVLPPALIGAVLAALAGILVGAAPWPVKVMRRLKYEHWGFVAMLTGLVIVPWAVTLLLCPSAIAAYGTVPRSALLKANLFSLSWGLANILGLISFMMIGISLTSGLLIGMGVSIGVVIPMIVKASGTFQDAPSLSSPAGLTVLGGVAVMVAGVVLMALAGFGREKVLAQAGGKPGAFLVGAILSILAGILSVGFSFAFVYSQAPIVEAMKKQGAGDVPANFAVWAVGLLGGALINVLYPAMLMTRNRSWYMLAKNPKEVGLAAVYGLTLVLGFACMGKGMILLGVLGASVGFGVQQAFQIVATQGVGFISGEWAGVIGKPRTQMYLAIAGLLVAAVIMAYGNTLTKV